MREEHVRELSQHDNAQFQDDRKEGLMGLLRRIVGPRAPEVLVMERDGQLRRASQGEPAPRS